MLRNPQPEFPLLKWLKPTPCYYPIESPSAYPPPCLFSPKFQTPSIPLLFQRRGWIFLSHSHSLSSLFRPLLAVERMGFRLPNMSGFALTHRRLHLLVVSNGPYEVMRTPALEDKRILPDHAPSPAAPIRCRLLRSVAVIP